MFRKVGGKNRLNGRGQQKKLSQNNLKQSENSRLRTGAKLNEIHRRRKRFYDNYDQLRFQKCKKKSLTISVQNEADFFAQRIFKVFLEIRRLAAKERNKVTQKDFFPLFEMKPLFLQAKFRFFLNL